MIYQSHPDHGRHIAYNPLEAEANIKNGWKTVTEDEFYGRETFPNELNDREKLELTYISIFGKKPHHKKADATIQAEINASNN